MQQNRFSGSSAFAAALSEALRASPVRAEATRDGAAAGERALLSAWGYTRRHTLTCSLLLSSRAPCAKCSWLIDHRSDRPAASSIWGHGGGEAAGLLCKCVKCRPGAVREINRWFQVGKEMEKSCIVFSKRERECNLLCPAEFCSFWEGMQECRWWELQAYLVGYLVQLRLDMGCTTQGSDTGVPRSSLLMLNWGRRNTQNTGKKRLNYNTSEVYCIHVKKWQMVSEFCTLSCYQCSSFYCFQTIQILALYNTIGEEMKYMFYFSLHSQYQHCPREFSQFTAIEKSSETESLTFPCSSGPFILLWQYKNVLKLKLNLTWNSL